jgi:hypothetical protein
VRLPASTCSWVVSIREPERPSSSAPARGVPSPPTAVMTELDAVAWVARDEDGLVASLICSYRLGRPVRVMVNELSDEVVVVCACAHSVP